MEEQNLSRKEKLALYKEAKQQRTALATTDMNIIPTEGQKTTRTKPVVIHI